MNLPLFKQNIWPELNALIEVKRYSKIAVLLDSNTLKYCLPIFTNEFEHEFEIIEIEPGEASKDLVICSHIWMQLSESLFDRNSLIINLGGGVVTDLGGFIAGVYKRGIDFINLPTSLLAMVDASVGHKCGIDFMNLKNQLGLFNEPKAVFITPIWLETLDSNNVKSAFAEMLKHGLISSKIHFEKLSALNENLIGIEQFIEESISIKSKTVQEDLTESGIRKTLNFGHTIGHALESLFLLKEKRPILHGFAVAFGMIIESRIANQLDLLSRKDLEQIEAKLFKFFKPIILEFEDIPQLISLMMHDKKSESGEIKMALIDSIGHCIASVSVDEQTIELTLRDYIHDCST